VQPEVIRVLKEDALGRIELARQDGELVVRRVADGGGFFGARFVARLLLARERRALAALAGLSGVARVLAADSPGVLVRSFVPGTPLCRAATLPRDYFERLEELVGALHERGVCHNDLHKEANVLVGDDGHPALVDFQLASVHRRRGRVFTVRAREDLRHVWKHRSCYLRALGERDPLADAAPARSALAEGWRRLGKPLYRVVTRARGLREPSEDGEARRRPGDPWPRWTAPVGRRSAFQEVRQ
jgi:hypothetical protein